MRGRRRYIGRANVAKLLAPLEGARGRSTYDGGTARFDLDSETVVVRPAFPLTHEGGYGYVHVQPLLNALGQDHLVGAILVRLGGYAVGVFDGERLLASKVGRRLVHGRHRAGGSSANRFQRRREEQARVLLGEAAEVAEHVLDQYRGRLDAIALGGDREAIRRMLELRPPLAWVEPLALPRFHAVPDPRQPVLERLPYELYAAEVERFDRPAELHS